MSAFFFGYLLIPYGARKHSSSFLRIAHPPCSMKERCRQVSTFPALIPAERWIDRQPRSDLSLPSYFTPLTKCSSPVLRCLRLDLMVVVKVAFRSAGMNHKTSRHTLAQVHHTRARSQTSLSTPTDARPSMSSYARTPRCTCRQQRPPTVRKASKRTAGYGSLSRLIFRESNARRTQRSGRLGHFLPIHQHCSCARTVRRHQQWVRDPEESSRGTQSRHYGPPQRSPPNWGLSVSACFPSRVPRCVEGCDFFVILTCKHSVTGRCLCLLLLQSASAQTLSCRAFPAACVIAASSAGTLRKK